MEKMNKWQKEFLEVLRRYYAEKKENDPSYSIRNMAKHLNISSGPASALIKGTRTWDFSKKWVKDVMYKMDLPSSTQNRLLVLMGEKPLVEKEIISPEPFEKILTTWYYPAVLHAVDLGRGKCSPESLAKRLDVSSNEVQAAIDYLIEKKILILDCDGHLERTCEAIETSDDIPHDAIRQHHGDSLHLAHKALQHIETNQREFQTITFPGSRSQIEEMKSEIRIFLDKIAVLMSQREEADEIYRLSLQLFPVNFQEHLNL